MKILAILVVIVAVIVLMYLVYFSVKNLRQIQKQARENPQLNREHELKIHPQTKKELAELAKQRQHLEEKKKK